MTSVELYPPDLAELESNALGADHRSPGGRWAIVAVSVMSVVLFVSPAISMLLYGFPLMVFLLAMYLYRRNVADYVGLVCWLWFLTPLFRRLVDYRAGWIPSTPILLAPPLAIVAPAVWLIVDWRKILRGRAAPLLCFLATCIYATFLGLMNFGARLVFQDLLSWVAPLLFTFLLCRHSEQAVELFQSFEKAFLYGMIVISIYGLVQFFLLPQWDALWMEEIDLASFGMAEPLKVRVFSTMNGPQVLAAFLAVGLIIAFNSRLKVRFVSIPLGLLCLMLSLARSGWVAVVAGCLYLLINLPQRQRFQLVVAVLLAVVGLIIAMQNPDLQQVISQRFETLSDTRDDVSFVARIKGYGAVFDGLMDNPFGLGMGVTPAAVEDKRGTTGFVRGGQTLIPADSTVSDLLTTMGFVGVLATLGLILPLARKLFGGASVNTGYTRTMRAVLIGLIAEALLCTVVAGPIGFLTWASVGFCIALGIADDPQPARAAIRVAA
jgi:hypothetical protein